MVDPIRAISADVRAGRVLVVDESGEFLECWTRELTSAGIQALATARPDEAVHFLADEEVTLAIINASSFERGASEPFYGSFRETQRPKIVFVTVDFTARWVLRLAQEGDLVLPGPLEPGILLNTVELLDGRQDDILRFATRYRLSPRETALFRHALAGVNNHEAAAALGCSRGTIATFWNRIFKKTGVSGQRNVIILFMHMARGSGTFESAKPDSHRRAVQ